MTEKMKQKMEELIESYPLHQYSITTSFTYCHATMVEEQEKIKKQLAIAVDGLKRIDKQRFLLGRDFMPYDVAVLILNQIEELKNGH